MLSEVCCGAESLLGKVSLKLPGCTVVRITESDDFTTEAGVHKAIHDLKRPQDGVWVSMPCTGGCRYQKFNFNKWESARRKMVNHWILFRRMKRSLIKVLEHCHRIGALIFIEWPKTCAYWQDPDIVSWIKRFNLRFAEFHGCQFGLTFSCTGTFPQFYQQAVVWSY